MALKAIPNDLIAEQSVLGSMFLSKLAIEKANESLIKNSFYDEKNGIIFQCIVDLYDKKVPIDLTTVTAELNQQNKLNTVGGVSYLTEIINTVPTAANVEYYIKTVEDTAMLRNVIDTSTEIATLAYEHDGDVSDVLDQVEQKIVGIIKNRKSGEFRSIQEVLNAVQLNLEKLAQSKGEITGIPTGWYELDKITSGLHENQLIILAARPAMGKTAFALNLATNVAINTDKTVAIFSLEMGAEQLANRIISSLGQIEGQKLTNGDLLNNDWKRITEAKSQLSKAKLYISDDAGVTVGDIKSKCRRLATSEDGLDLVIIDHLQLLTMGGNYGNNRQAEITDISRSLKKMAMELNIPVIALAQLSRGVESREDKRPKMSDLRESGSIEQDADIVALLYRDDYYQAPKEMNEAPDPSLSELIIGKHRNGPTGKIDLLFRKNTSTFLNFIKDNKGENNG
ncbi:MAG: replicative DNA helicase [Firmicutes bacterium]|nr:replicative DNA helicase [Bacillota bacterium]